MYRCTAGPWGRKFGAQGDIRALPVNLENALSAPVVVACIGADTSTRLGGLRRMG
jgi:hypothetical protein